MSDLPEFLLERYAEDEAVAVREQEYRDSLPPVPVGVSIAIGFADWFGPSQVIADLEAKRSIVALHHERDISPSCAECGGYTATVDNVRGITHHGYAIPWPCPTLRLLALPYADHPDYREEWKP